MTKSPADTRFTTWFLAVVALCLAGIATFTALGDAPPANELPGAERFGGAPLKVQLLERAATPDFVVLGSSRVQRFDPQQVTTATGTTGFNAGVVGASITDNADLAAWIAARARSTDTPMPHLVLGIAPESFEPQGPPSVDLDLPEVAGNEEATIDRLRAAAAAATRLIQFDTVRRTVRSLALDSESDATEDDSALDTLPGGPGTTTVTPAPADVSATAAAQVRGEAEGGPADSVPPPATRPEPDPAPVSPIANVPPTSKAPTPFQDPITAEAGRLRVRSDGYLTSGPYVGAVDGGAGEDGWDEQYRTFYRNVEARGGGVDASALRALERFLRVANEAGDEPTLVMLPIQPRLATLLDAFGRREYAKAVEQELASLADRYDFLVVDGRLPDGIAADDDAFFDGVHPRPRLARAIVAQLVAADRRLQ